MSQATPRVDGAESALSIIIPAFDEAERLPETVAALRAFLDARPWGASAQVVLVDDGSSDGTGEVIAQAAAADRRITPLVYAPNRGKGAAVKAGIAVATGDPILFFDADLSYDLRYIDDALARFAEGADVVVGARDLSPDDSRRRYGWGRRLASKVFNGLVQRSLDLGLRDTQCGFKAFRGPVAKALFESVTIPGFGFDVEVLFLARHWGLRIDAIPVEMRPTAGSSVSLVRNSIRMARDIAGIRRRARRGAYPTAAPSEPAEGKGRPGPAHAQGVAHGIPDPNV